jgi:hypothetical protein
MKLVNPRSSVAQGSGTVAVVLTTLALSIPSSTTAAVPLAPLAASLTAQAGTGTIKGRVVWGGDDAPERKILFDKGAATKDPSVCAKNEVIPAEDLVVDPKTKGVRNAIVFLVKPKGSTPGAAKSLLAKAPQVDIDQVNCRFVPHVTAIHQNQTLQFKSSDPTNHNVRYSGFKNTGQNKNLPPNGTLSVKLLSERLPMEVKCDIHPWMTAWIMVLDHPYFAVTGDDGSFEIEGVPAGAQNVVVWQERAGYVNQGAGRGAPAKVEAGKVLDLGTITVDPKKAKAK